MANKTRKQLIEEFEAHCLNIRQQTATGTPESDKERLSRINRAIRDPRFFASYYFPHYCKADSADFHIEAANKIRKYRKIRGLLEWYRGGAKSTWIDIIIPMWLKIQQPREINTMVLIGKSYLNAKVLLSDVQAEFVSNERYIADFGEQFQNGSWEEGQFITKDGVAFYAKGRGQSPRGLRNRQNRPDYIAIDDIDDEELVLNEVRVDKLVRWIFGALFNTMDDGRGRFVMVGNLFAAGSTLAKVKERLEKMIEEAKQKAFENPMQAAIDLATDGRDERDRQYVFLTKVCIDDENENPAWPSKTSRADIKELKALMTYREIQAEFYHNPISGGKIFKEHWMQFKKMPDLGKYKRLVAYLDGGFKDTKTADDKALVLTGLKDGELHIVKAYLGNASIETMVDWHYDLDKWLKSKNATCVWMMEEVFLLDLLYKDFKAAKARHGYMIPIQGDKRKKPDKDLRISATAGVFERGNVWINEAEKESHHMQRLMQQFFDFEPPKKTHKDGPDAFEGGKFILEAMLGGSDGITHGGKGRNNRY